MLNYIESVTHKVMSVEHSVDTGNKKFFKNPFALPLSETRMSQGMNTILRSESLNLPSRTMEQDNLLFVSAFISSIFHLYHYLFNFSDTNYLPSSKFKNIPITTCHNGNDNKSYIEEVCFEILSIKKLLWLRFSWCFPLSPGKCQDRTFTRSRPKPRTSRSVTLLVTV